MGRIWKLIGWLLVIAVVVGGLFLVYQKMDIKKQSPKETTGITANPANSLAGDIGGLKKEIAELEKKFQISSEANVQLHGQVSALTTRVAELEKCACNKPAPKQPVKKVAKAKAKASAPPAPAPATPAPKAETKGNCAPSAPKPEIIRPRHMPLGALPSASFPNCK